MSSTFVQVAGGVGRKVLTGTVLSLIGLTVGFGCALLPPAVPFTIVGIAGVLLLWVLPDLAYVPDRWVRRMLPVFLFVYICIPNYFAIILPGIPWISMHDLTLLLWLTPLLAVIAGSADARHRISAVLRASPWLSACTLGFIATTIITLPTAAYFSTSFHSVLNSLLNWYIPMFGLIVCVRDRRAFDTLFKIIVITTYVNFVLGSIEEVLGHPYLIYALPSSMRELIAANNPIAAKSMYVGWGIRKGLYRASASFTTSLTWGEICAMFFPFALHFVAHGRITADRALGAVGAVVCGLSVILSGARGAYVAIIAAGICYSIAWAFRTTILYKKGMAGQIALALYSMASGATLLAVMFVPAIHNRVIGGGAEEQSTLSRSVQWALAEPKIQARPVLGYGGGSAGEVIHYVSGLGGYSVDGYYMNLLVDYGIPGCVIFFSMFLLAIGVSLKGYIFSKSEHGDLGNALGSSILAFVIYRTTLSQTDSMPLAFMSLALTKVYAYLNRPKTADHNPSTTSSS